MSHFQDAQAVAQRAAIVGSQEMLRRMVATGHIWPATMQAHIDRHGIPECLAPKPPKPSKRPQGQHDRRDRAVAREFGKKSILVLNHVAEREDITVEAMRGHMVTRPLMHARRRAIRIMHRLGFSTSEIGRAMNRDRASILNSLKVGECKHR